MEVKDEGGGSESRKEEESGLHTCMFGLQVPHFRFPCLHEVLSAAKSDLVVG